MSHNRVPEIPGPAAHQTVLSSVTILTTIFADGEAQHMAFQKAYNFNLLQMKHVCLTVTECACTKFSNLYFGFALGNQQMLRVHQTTSTVTVVIKLQP